MKKIILGALICIMALGMFACKDKDEKIEYNDKEAHASGMVTLEGDDPDINITNIKAKVGADIDYLSGVVVEDEEKFEDLKVWVDASAVDIYEPGDYKAKYTFEYNGKSVEHYITVTIVEAEGEESAGESDNAQNNGEGQNNVQGDNGAGDSDGNVENNAGNSQESQITQNVADNNVATTKQESTTKNQNVGTTKPTNSQNASTNTTTKPTATTKPTTTTKPTASSNNTMATTTGNSGSSSETTSRRQMITSAGNTTTKTEDIGYAYIDLLSGSTVSIKSTTERYILLTRTDVTYITKNGVDYKVSKLVIRYNTGEERTLETVEEKCN